MKIGKKAIFMLVMVCMLASIFLFSGCDSPVIGGDKELSAPTGLRVTATASVALISWNSVSGATGYVVYVAQNSESASAQLYTSVTGTSCSFSFPESTQTTRYYFWVKSTKGSEVSSFSASVSTIKDSDNGGGGSVSVPSPPTGLVAVAVSSSSISVSWTASQNASSYTVYYKKSDNSQSDNAEPVKLTRAGTSSSLSYTVTGLSQNTLYRFWVKASNSAGESDFSILWTFAITSESGSGGGSTSLSPPTGVTASIGSKKINIFWNTVSGATEYLVYYNTTPSSYDSVLGATVYTTSCDFEISIGANDTTFYFWIKAANSKTTSNFSTFAQVVVSGTPSWNPPSVYQEITSAGAVNAIVRNVTAGQTYWFRVYASQPSNSQYTYTISFFDIDSDSTFTSNVVGTFYNQNGVIFRANVDNGTFGPSASYILSQNLYIKIEAKKSGTFAIYYERTR